MPDFRFLLSGLRPGDCGALGALGLRPGGPDPAASFWREPKSKVGVGEKRVVLALFVNGRGRSV
ncbi:MAG: hypothetical protein ACFB21_01100, partial [Opitutales bacterium]